MPWPVALFAIAAIFVIAHLLGRKLAQYRQCQVGWGREVMPTFVRRRRKKRGDEKEWNERVRRAEQKILDRYDGDIRAATASGLAVELSELPVVMEAALDHMRQEIPCRLSVTSAGELVHDFDALHLDALRGLKKKRGLKRTGLRFVALMANISAVWPVVIVAMMALAAFYTIFSNSLDDFSDNFAYAFFGVLIVAAGVISAWALSGVLKFIARPFGMSLPLDYAHTPRRVENPLPGSDRWSHFLSNRSPRKSRSASSRGVRSEGGMGAGPYMIFLAIYAVLATVCLFTVYVWVRGMIRAVRGRDEPTEEYGPAAWIRHLEEVDWFERFIPTNDLISRMVRALRRTLFQRRPSDLQLLGRILNNGPLDHCRISALDIALSEALDPAEVAEVGVELCHRLDGEVHVTDEGEMIFEFDAQELKTSYFPDGPIYEFLERRGPLPTDLRRRIEFPGMKLPVNLVGLKYAHLKASNFLIGGAILMFLATLYVITSVDPGVFEGALPTTLFSLTQLFWQFGTVAVGLMWIVTLGTVCLAVTTRYLAAAAAIEGVQRDARRVFAHVLADALSVREKTLDMNPWIRQLRGLFEKIDSRFDEDFFRKECVALLEDFGLHDEIDTEESKALESVDIRRLHRRIKTIRQATSSELSWADEDFDDDDILFEALVDHDDIRAL